MPLTLLRLMPLAQQLPMQSVLATTHWLAVNVPLGLLLWPAPVSKVSLLQLHSVLLCFLQPHLGSLLLVEGRVYLPLLLLLPPYAPVQCCLRPALLHGGCLHLQGCQGLPLLLWVLLLVKVLPPLWLLLYLGQVRVLMALHLHSQLRHCVVLLQPQQPLQRQLLCWPLLQ